MIMASSPRVMGAFVIPAYLKTMGWIATAVILCAAFGICLTWR
jgi:hypothetical protein